MKVRGGGTLTKLWATGPGSRAERCNARREVGVSGLKRVAAETGGGEGRGAAGWVGLPRSHWWLGAPGGRGPPEGALT